MKRIKLPTPHPPSPGWDCAALVMARYLAANRKADELLEALPNDLLEADRRSCQSLFMGALRHGPRLRDALRPLRRKPPRPRLEAILLVAGTEMLEADAGRRARVIHHAVDRARALASGGEARFANAVLRRLPERLAEQEREGRRAVLHAHPEWLVARWDAAFGETACDALLAWDQRAPAAYARIPAEADRPEPAAGLEPTAWPAFHRVDFRRAGETLRPLLAVGRAYIKDPSTRFAAESLGPVPGEAILDLCAAPGGKTFDLAHALEGRGTLAAVDFPGGREARLRANLAQIRERFPDGLRLESVGADALALDAARLREAGLPETYDGVLLDAPCSNTGVLQRRPDAKWRLAPESIPNAAALQKRLLAAAARFVRPGGRIVYSTCSIEAEENEAVVDAFLESPEGRAFAPESRFRSFPWESGHDGAGAARLRRATR